MYKVNRKKMLIGISFALLTAGLITSIVLNVLFSMKNMTYMEYCADYGVGESDDLYLLFPKNLKTISLSL